MLIHEASKITGLTKKAIEYYIDQGLIRPGISDNGYRNFTERDIELLKKIFIYRKIDLSLDEIKAVLSDGTGEMLRTISLRRELNMKRDRAKQDILERLSIGEDPDKIEAALSSIDQNRTIMDKLSDVFPGYYGRFLCIHFAEFLKEPISTPQQQEAYDEILHFLDGVPALIFPQELQDFLMDIAQHMNTEKMAGMNEQVESSIANMDEFISQHREWISAYLNFRRSQEYLDSPAYQIHRLLTEFNKINGYYDVFIPAMKKLSSSYAEYHRVIKTANDKLMREYPEISEIIKN